MDQADGSTPNRSPEQLQDLYQQLVELHSDILSSTAALIPEHAAVDNSPSRLNLAHYLALRQRELRPLQENLAQLALSSLGRSEAHVMYTLDSLLWLLSRMLGLEPSVETQIPVTLSEGQELLGRNIAHLFGEAIDQVPHVMVTLPAEAAADPGLVDQLAAAGADCFRINCAHDSQPVWEQMIAAIRSVEQARSRRFRVLMDLGGPKVRTRLPVDQVDQLRLRPRKLPGGKRRRSLTILFSDQRERLLDHRGAGILFAAEQLAQVASADRLEFEDARGRRRHFVVDRRGDRHTVWASCTDKTVLDSNTVFNLCPDQTSPAEPESFGALAFYSPLEPLKVRSGETILLRSASSELSGGEEPSHIGQDHEIGIEPATVIGRLSPGIRVWFDDGKLGGVVETNGSSGALVRIDRAPVAGVKLGTDKGVNCPGVDLGIAAITPKDIVDLDFVVANADLVGMSFVERLADVQRLVDEISRRESSLPIVLKIETGTGVSNLPAILLDVIDSHPIGVMIARGDLAVEVGGERMAELQEELLWLCEAAHVPVVWATQVLETFVKEGRVARPEMTDAATAGRADCVMLNKGPFIVDGVRMLREILRRMQGHQHKKSSRLRPLAWSPW